MPRDASGNYALPPGNPVVPHDIIDTDWANPTMDDIADALTDSLSRTGSGGMLVSFKNADGTVSAPGMSWVNEPTSGWYHNGLNDFWYSVGNENIFRITKNGVELAPGKTALNFVSGIKIQDADPSPVSAGSEWFESDTGALYMRYQNPDLTFTWIQINMVGGNYAVLDAGGKLPAAQINPMSSLVVNGPVALGTPSGTDALTLNTPTWTQTASLALTRDFGTAGPGNGAGPAWSWNAPVTVATDPAGGSNVRNFSMGTSVAGANNYASLTGIRNTVTHAGTGVGANNICYQGVCTISGGGSVTSFDAFRSQRTVSSGSATTMGGFHSTDMSNLAVVNSYGFICDDFANPGVGTSAAFNSNMNAAVNKWGVLCGGTAQNGFVGKTRFGSNSQPVAQVDVIGDIAATTTIRSSGPTSGIGYATGAGGTVVQGAGSGKATAVNLDKVSGQITMNNAALAANTGITFTVNDAAVAATDVVFANHGSAGTTGAYQVQANNIRAGAFDLTVRNVSGGSLSEAIVINFAVVKAVNA